MSLDTLSETSHGRMMSSRNPKRSSPLRTRPRRNFGWVLCIFQTGPNLDTYTDRAPSLIAGELLGSLPNARSPEGHPAVRRERSTVWSACQLHWHHYQGQLSICIASCASADLKPSPSTRVRRRLFKFSTHSSLTSHPGRTSRRASRRVERTQKLLASISS
jgi:hypothetical protein